MKNFDIIEDIPMYSNWLKIEPVYKGWSDDKKFYIEDSEGQRMLLRLTDISWYEAKRHEYDSMNIFLTLKSWYKDPL